MSTSTVDERDTNMQRARTREIWIQMHERLFSYIRRRVAGPHDAEDLLQDVFVRIHTNLDDVRNTENVSGWIYQITRNAITDYYRHRAASAGALAGLAEGAVTWIGGADRSLDLAYVYGRGLHRSTDGGATWERVEEPPSLPLPGLLNPRADVVPFAVAADERGGTWLAGVGGLFRTLDGVDWTTMPVASSGSFNVLFTGIDTEGGDVWAVAQLADSMLPASFQGLLSGTVFHGRNNWSP